MEWVRSRVSLQQQLREDDRIQQPRGRRVTANVAVGQLLWGAFLFPFFYVVEVASERGECMTWGKKGEVQQRENSPCSFALETPEMLLDRITRIWRRSEETDGVRQKLPHTVMNTTRRIIQKWQYIQVILVPFFPVVTLVLLIVTVLWFIKTL